MLNNCKCTDSSNLDNGGTNSNNFVTNEVFCKCKKQIYLIIILIIIYLVVK